LSFYRRGLPNRPVFLQHDAISPSLIQ
jgi:hypothetical protein